MPPVFGTDVLHNYAPPVDGEALSADKKLITTAGNYDGDIIDLGAGYNGDRHLYFQFSDDLAGGTSLQPILMTDADGVAGSPVVEQTGRAIALASLPMFYRMAIPAGTRYVQPRVASLGTFTAGGYTAWVAE